MGTSAHSELDYASSSTGDLHSAKRRSGTISQRQFVTKVGFPDPIALLRPRQACRISGPHSADQTGDFGGLCYEVRNLLDEVPS
jgi:hypothetical protein